MKLSEVIERLSNPNIPLSNQHIALVPVSEILSALRRLERTQQMLISMISLREGSGATEGVDLTMDVLRALAIAAEGEK